MTERGYGVDDVSEETALREEGSRWEAYGRSEEKVTDKGWKRRL